MKPKVQKEINRVLYTLSFTNLGTGSSDDPDSIGYDLALLASCNHSIMTWGSFSMWGTFLAGGKYYSEYGVIIPEHLQEPEKKKKGKKN